MRLNCFFMGTVILIITISIPMDGKRITMLPLTAQEVYRILREAGKEDAVPEGRVVSQGIAAVSGFALGLAKGIGGTALLGAAALSGLVGGGNSGSNCCQQQSQEVCFTSRSLNEIYDGEEEDVPEGRQTSPTTPTTPTTPTSPLGPTTTTPGDISAEPPVTTTYNDYTPTYTTTTYPDTTTTGDGTDGGTDTYVDTGDGTDTQTGTTTQTGTGGAVNCVVVQQPCSCSSGTPVKVG